MKRLFAFTFLFALFLSCKDDFTKINKRGIIPREKFVEILADIHLIDVMAGSPSYSRKYEAGDTVDLNQAVFDKYNVTKIDFDSTVAMYVRQPEVYIKVYDEVLLKLNYMLDTMKNNNPKFSNGAEIE
jgi:hypothetical protein